MSELSYDQVDAAQLETLLPKFVEKNYNILLIGSHGIGKTLILKQTLVKLKYTFKYFSTSTMDPYTDLIGIPNKELDPERDNIPYIDYILPKGMRDDIYDYMIFDEFNRAGREIKNAVMECLQFKSINGRKFNKLKGICAAINDAADETYDTEPLDAAQLDRFHIKLRVANKINTKYFRDNYGFIGSAGAEWWDSLSSAQKQICSPRNLEYALSVFKDGLDVSHTLHLNTNPKSLAKKLNDSLTYQMMHDFMHNKNVEGAKKFLEDQNNLNQAVAFLQKTETEPEYSEFYLPILSAEVLTSQYRICTKIKNYMTKHKDSVPEFKSIIDGFEMSGPVEVDTELSTKEVAQYEGMKVKLQTNLIPEILDSETKFCGIIQAANLVKKFPSKIHDPELIKLIVESAYKVTKDTKGTKKSQHAQSFIDIIENLEFNPMNKSVVAGMSEFKELKKVYQ